MMSRTPEVNLSISPRISTPDRFFGIPFTCKKLSNSADDAKYIDLQTNPEPAIVDRFCDNEKATGSDLVVV